jgi:hypothetical protein
MLRFRLGGVDGLNETLDRRRSRQTLGRVRVDSLLGLIRTRRLLRGGRGYSSAGAEEQ